MIEKYRIKLKTLSPIFIGDTQALVPAHHYIENRDGYRRIKEDSFFEYFGDNRIDSRDLQKPMKENSYFFSKYKNSIAYSVKNNVGIYREVHPFVRNPFYNPYIPGSSLKGCFRTSLLLTKVNLDELNRNIRNQLNTPGKDFQKKSNLGRYSKQIDGKLNGRINARRGNSQQNDFFRVFRFSDSMELSKDCMNMGKVGVFSLAREGFKLKKNFIRSINKSFPMIIYMELLPADTEIIFELSFDRDLFERFTNKFEIEGIDELFENVYQASEKILAKDINFYSENTKLTGVRMKLETIRNMREVFIMGFGSGLLGTTLFPLIQDDLGKQIRNLTSDRGDAIAPKSRRLVLDTNNNAIDPMGWVQVIEKVRV